MSNFVVSIIGWIPAIVFPGASLIQLFTVIRSRDVASVSAPTWFLFSIANIAAYFYLQKYLEPQALAYIVAALIQFSIVIVVVKKRKQDL